MSEKRINKSRSTHTEKQITLKDERTFKTALLETAITIGGLISSELQLARENEEIGKPLFGISSYLGSKERVVIRKTSLPKQPTFFYYRHCD